MLKSLLTLLALFCVQIPGESQTPVLKTGGMQSMPLEWIDADTVHKVKRISERPGSNRSFTYDRARYFPNGLYPVCRIQSGIR